MTHTSAPPPTAVSSDICQEYVLPGDVRAAAVPTRFVTILGSCVSICLYDPVRNIGGINHFLLPGAPPAGESEPLRWGDASIAELFRKVIALGGNPRFLQAKVFGGAQISARPVPGNFHVGERNIEQALRELDARGVDVRSHSLAGMRGRKLIFESHSGMAWVKELVPVAHQQ